MSGDDLIIANAGLAKGQLIRLVDMALLGPGLIWAGTQQKTAALRWFLILAGVGTITYNYTNYASHCAAADYIKAAYKRAGLAEPGVRGEFLCDVLT